MINWEDVSELECISQDGVAKVIVKYKNGEEHVCSADYISEEIRLEDQRRREEDFIDRIVDKVVAKLKERE